jgi:hypothetical protein
VLDITQFVAGPTASRILGELGADVINVELAPRRDGHDYAAAERNAIRRPSDDRTTRALRPILLARALLDCDASSCHATGRYARTAEDPGSLLPGNASAVLRSRSSSGGARAGLA